MTSNTEQREARRRADAARDFAAAVAHERAGRGDRAAALYRKVLQKTPDNVDALHRLGLNAHAHGREQRAVQLIERALALDPAYGAAHVNLGNALRALGRGTEAEASYRRALAIDPDNAFAHANLAAVHNDRREFELATTAAERALALAPDLTEAHVNRAEALIGLGRPAEAEAALRHAAALQPERAATQAALGRVLVALGRPEEAKACYRAALLRAPDLAAVHSALAALGEPPAEGALERLRRLAEASGAKASERIAADFALGAFADRAGEYEEAFSRFARANAMLHAERARDGAGFDAASFRREIGALIGRSNKDLFAAARAWGIPSERPVFVVGMPRSGVALVARIAASANGVVTLGARPDLAELAAAIVETNRGRPVAEWDTEAIRGLGEAFLARLDRLGGGALRVVDATPENVLHLGIAAVLFPGARVIFCRRDPRDVALSCHFRAFTEGSDFSSDLADCARRAREIERLSEHWREVLPLPMLTIAYEALVADPEGESRRLATFLRLDGEARALARREDAGAGGDAGVAVHDRSAGRSRHYERHLAPLRAVLGEDGAGVRRMERDP